ncbi:MAG: carboxypeptidase-like regulatory domain-containing protein [Bacteroidota bacterium]
MRAHIIILAVFFALCSCKKEAGILGKKKLSGTVYYKNGVSAAYEPAPSAVVKIAYGASAATSSFDQTLLSNADGSYKIEGLKRGDYYVWSEFTDTYGFVYSTPGYLVDINSKKGDLNLDIMLE